MVCHLHVLACPCLPGPTLVRCTEVSISPLCLRKGRLALLKERHTSVNHYKLQKKGRRHPSTHLHIVGLAEKVRCGYGHSVATPLGSQYVIMVEGSTPVGHGSK